MRKGIVFLLLLTVILWTQPQIIAQENELLVYVAQPDDIMDIRMELYNESQTFTGMEANVSISDPYGKVIENFNHTVTSVSHVWFAWHVPADAPTGNYTIFAYEYYSMFNTSAVVIVYIPYIIVITGFVMNSYGSTYPSYPVTFLNFNRTELVTVETDKDGYYSLALYNTTIGDMLYGVAKMIAEESSVILVVEGNFTQSFRTQPLPIDGGGIVGGDSGRDVAVAQRDAVFFATVSIAFISLGTVVAVFVKMAKK